MPEDLNLKKIFLSNAKTLIAIYIALTVVFFAVSYLVSKLDSPYDKRAISTEVTPWLK